MKILLQKPQYFFFALIPVFLIFSWWGIEKYVNLAFFNSYLSVKISHWSMLSALFAALIGINYVLVGWAKKKLIVALSFTHIILQFLSTIGFIYSLLKIGKQDFDNATNYHQILSISFFVFLISIVTHMFNFFLSLFKKS